MFPVLAAERYLLPLREGGSLPAVVDTEAGRYAVKFIGAGQGARALVAELIVAGVAGALGLPVPETVIVQVTEGFGRAEPDPEIQDILRGSAGPNVGLRFIDGALPYDPVAAADLIDAELAAEIVWLDALVTNVDRTARNPNMLVAGQPPTISLIDHGAALYFHHDWPSVTDDRARAPFAAISEHVLLPRASSIVEADDRLASHLDPDAVHGVLESIPGDLLMHVPPGHRPAFSDAGAHRQAYARWFTARLEAPRAWAASAEAARVAALAAPRRPLAYRR